MKRGLGLPAKLFLAAFFFFLYAPIASVVGYSFNESALASVWAGFSFKWYAALAHDEELTNAAWLSLQVGVAAASASVVLGTWAAVALTRFGRFRGMTLFRGMLNAPLVLPEVILGMSLLLLFVAAKQWTGWPSERGMLTIWIGHVMSCSCYVAITVQGRLATLPDALLEAAQDLGAPPLRVFFGITLPLIAPSLVSGWLLAFTISLDNVLISAFLSGPGTTLLPLVVFSRARLGLNPEVNALGALLILLVTAGMLGANVMARRLARELEA